MGPRPVVMDNPLRSGLIRLAHARPELRPHLLPILKDAGALVPMQTVYLSVVPRRGNTPFNSDHLFGLERIFLPVKGVPGGVKVVPLDSQRSPGRFTWAEEKAGARNETVVTVQVPKAAVPQALKAIAAALPEFRVTALPAYRAPGDITPAAKTATGPTPGAIVDYILEALESAHGMEINVPRLLRWEVADAVEKMLRDGVEFTADEIELLANGSDSDRLRAFSGIKGYAELDRAMDRLFNSAGMTGPRG